MTTSQAKQEVKCQPKQRPSVDFELVESSSGFRFPSAHANHTFWATAFYQDGRIKLPLTGITRLCFGRVHTCSCCTLTDGETDRQSRLPSIRLSMQLRHRTTAANAARVAAAGFCQALEGAEARRSSNRDKFRAADKPTLLRQCRAFHDLLFTTADCQQTLQIEIVLSAEGSSGASPAAGRDSGWRRRQALVVRSHRKNQPARCQD